MKIYKSVFMAFVFICMGTAIWVGISGSRGMTDVDVRELRVDQLKDINLDPGRQIQPEWMMGSIDAGDYFERTPQGFRYLGGLYHGQWKTGEVYLSDELRIKNEPESQVHALLNLPVGSHGLYLNIDRGDEEVTRQFLQALDLQGKVELDSLILDFRFLRKVDFGSVLRLFNQFAPQERMVFGKIVNAHQEQEIRSSGRPFFPVDHTVFLVNEYLPSSVKRLIMKLSEGTSYSVAGDLGQVADTVCLYTDFVIGPETYRVCTDKLATEFVEDPLSAAVDFPPDSTGGMQWIREMDQLWYKQRDTAAMKKYIKVLIGQLLPQEN